MTNHGITDAELAAAFAAGRGEAETAIRAGSVRYSADRDAVEIVTTRHAGVLIPLGWIGALHDVPIEDLDRLELWPDGSAIELEDHDIHISVDGLITALLPAPTMASIFASRGGRAASDAKRRSAQKNGQRGGRPRKATKTEAA